MSIMLLIIAIFIRPLICSPAFPDMNLIYSILLPVLLTGWIIQKKLSFKEHKESAAAILLFIGILSISLIFSENKLLAAEELAYNINGIMLFIICRSLSYEGKHKIIWTLIASGIFIAILAAYQYVLGFQNIINYMTENKISDPYVVDYINQKRVYYPFITPNALGGYLIMIIPIALAIQKKPWIAFLLFLPLLLTKSIGALLSLFFTIAIYFYLKGGLTKKTVLLLLGILVALALIFIIRTQTTLQAFQPFFSSEMRWHYWQDTLSIIRSNFWTGTGLGNFDMPYSRYTHNAYLQIWAETGIFGLLSFVFLIVTIFKSGFKEMRASSDKIMSIGLISAACAFLIHNLMDFTLFLPELSLLWWAILGLLSHRTQRASL